VHNFEFQQSPDGWEQDIQVNVLSTTILGLLMIPWLREIKQPGRVQHLGFVGSSSHYFPDILTFPKQGVLQHFNQQEHWASGLHNYAISKLLFHYGALQLAKLAVDDDGKYEFLSHAHSNLTCISSHQYG